MNQSKASDAAATTKAQLRNEAVLFISDLHLKAEMPATAAAFLNFLNQHAIKARQLYLLGDIFEYWAGDDDLNSPFSQKIVQALRKISQAGVELFWIAGNRDFLVGRGFAEAVGATLLPETHIIFQASKKFLITHGDALCTDDVDYQRFRLQVRNPQWQAAFLARPLEERKAIIASVRKESQQHQQKQMQQSESIVDVNPEAVAKLFSDNDVHTVIHGHTHRPAVHRVGNNVRYVLSDWDQDSDADKLRGDWLALQNDGTILRFNYLGEPIAE